MATRAPLLAELLASSSEMSTSFVSVSQPAVVSGIPGPSLPPTGANLSQSERTTTNGEHLAGRFGFFGVFLVAS